MTNSGQLQGILTENEGILFGPAIKPEARNLRRAVAVPASVIRKLLKQPEKPEEVNTALPHRTQAARERCLATRERLQSESTLVKRRYETGDVAFREAHSPRLP